MDGLAARGVKWLQSSQHHAKLFGVIVMKPGETIRFACEDCQVVFDLCVAPLAEWAEQIDENDIEGGFQIGEPVLCPFCGSSELKATHDSATQLNIGQRG
jgi:hypothetical protein